MVKFIYNTMLTRIKNVSMLSIFQRFEDLNTGFMKYHQ